MFLYHLATLVSHLNSNDLLAYQIQKYTMQSKKKNRSDILNIYDKQVKSPMHEMLYHKLYLLTH